jgi:CheY-like chemotaxis protein
MAKKTTPSAGEEAPSVVLFPTTSDGISPRDRLLGEGPPVEPARTGLHILVVEDNADSAFSTALLLRLYGHEVQVVHDGMTALRAIQDDVPDVVLLDIGLPGLDGWQVAEKMQRPPNQKRPMLIAITGYGQEDDRRRSTEVGIDLHLVKPVDPTHLQEILRKFQSLLR